MSPVRKKRHILSSFIKLKNRHLSIVSVCWMFVLLFCILGWLSLCLLDVWITILHSSVCLCLSHERVDYYLAFPQLPLYVSSGPVDYYTAFPSLPLCLLSMWITILHSLACLCMSHGRVNYYLAFSRHPVYVSWTCGLLSCIHSSAFICLLDVWIIILQSLSSLCMCFPDVSRTLLHSLLCLCLCLEIDAGDWTAVLRLRVCLSLSPWRVEYSTFRHI